MITAAEIRISTFFEKLIEHRFIADIMMLGWYKYKIVVEILKTDIDSSGYDIVLLHKNTTRYIQLKTSIAKGKTSYQTVNISLLNKENPCIIWIIRKYDEQKQDLDIKYLFWGAELGKKVSVLEEYRIPKDKNGKKEKPNHRNIPKSKFKRCKDIDDLFQKLFNIKK